MAVEISRVTNGKRHGLPGTIYSAVMSEIIGKGKVHVEGQGKFDGISYWVNSDQTIITVWRRSDNSGRTFSDRLHRRPSSVPEKMIYMNDEINDQRITVRTRSSLLRRPVTKEYRYTEEKEPLVDMPF